MAKFLRHTKPDHMKSVFCVALLFSAGLTSSSLMAAAPVVDASSSTVKNLENRINRLETRMNNQGLGDLINRLEQLQREMQRVIGELEVQSHELKTLKEQQRKVYSDIDSRIRKMEQAIANPGQTGTQGGSGANVPVAPATGLSGQSGGSVPVLPRDGGTATAPQQPLSPQQKVMTEVERNLARSAYERAFNLLKQGRYDLAIKSFEAFLETYPTAAYADNAQYWLGEANYAKKRYKVALTEFKKVIDNYPSSPKRADAMLKMGYTYGELGDNRQAMQTLNTIVSTFPDTTAAKLAQKRLKNLKSR